MGTQLPCLKGAHPPVFGPCLLWSNGWMGEDATWYESRPQPRPHCVRWGPSSPRERDTAARPLFSAHVYCGLPSQLLPSSCLKSEMADGRCSDMFAVDILKATRLGPALVWCGCRLGVLYGVHTLAPPGKYD